MTKYTKLEEAGPSDSTTTPDTHRVSRLRSFLLPISIFCLVLFTSTGCMKYGFPALQQYISLETVQSQDGSTSPVSSTQHGDQYLLGVGKADITGSV